MSNPIPPLLCCTPPPIDFNDGNEQDDFGDFETGDIEFDGSTIPTSPMYDKKSGDEGLDPPLPNEVDYCLYPPPDISALNLSESTPEKEKLKEKKSSQEIIQTYENVNNVQNHQNTTSVNEKLEDNIANKNINNFIKKTEFKENLTKATAAYQEDSSWSSNENIHLEQNYSDKSYSSSINYDSNTISKISVPNFNEGMKPIENVGIINDHSIVSAFPLEINETIVDENYDANVQGGKNVELNCGDAFDTNCETFIEEDFQRYDNSVSEMLPTFASSDISQEFCNSVQKEENNCTIEGNPSGAFFSNVGDSKNNILDNEIISSINEEQKTDFVADFSNFELAQSENVSNVTEMQDKDGDVYVEIDKKEDNKENIFNDDFEEFQNFTTAEVPTTAEDKDEFSDFDDYKCAVADTDAPNRAINVEEKIKSILNMMFPINENVEETGGIEVPSQNSTIKLVSNLNEIDSAKALDYQWANSDIKQSLIKALAIDSRNILYGEKWSTSMPRFAANLGFNPLEPLKPVKVSTAESSSISSKSRTGVEGQSDVPAVEFDWNTSGLVNPLDGIKEILHEGKIETTRTPELAFSNDSIKPQANETPTSNNEKIDCATVFPNITNDLTNTKEDDKNIRSTGPEENMTPTEFQFCSTSTYTVPLKETHIFTSNKTENVFSENVDCTTKRDSIDFDYKMAAAGIIIDEKVVKKEYRDIEYDPKKLKVSSGGVSSFKDFESPITENRNIICKNDSDININILEFVSKQTYLNEPKCNQVKNSLNALSKDLQSIPTISSKVIEDDSANEKSEEFSNYQFSWPTTNSSDSLKMIHSQKISSDLAQSVNCSHSEQNKSPNSKKIDEDDNNGDDEFSDFQYVPPPPPEVSRTYNEFRSRTQTPILHDEMILSPVVLLPQAIKINNSNPKIDWPEPGVNIEELTKIEELYSQSKGATVKTAFSNDDDDWSDFVSVPAVNNISGVLSSKQNYLFPSNQGNDDEWTDFVSSTPVQWNSDSINSNQIEFCNQSHIYHHINPYESHHCPQYVQPPQYVPTSKCYEETNTSMINQYSFPSYLKPVEGSKTKHNEKVSKQQRGESILKSQLVEPSSSLIPDLEFATPPNIIKK